MESSDPWDTCILFIHMIPMALILLMVLKSGEKTTWIAKKRLNNVISYIATGAGFLPSTVCTGSI